MKYLELARRQCGWSLKELGDDPRVRIARQFLSLIERGIATNPDPDQLRRLSTVLGVRPPERLLDDVPEAMAITAPEDVEATRV